MRATSLDRRRARAAWDAAGSTTFDATQVESLPVMLRTVGLDTAQKALRDDKSEHDHPVIVAVVEWLSQLEIAEDRPRAIETEAEGFAAALKAAVEARAALARRSDLTTSGEEE